MCHYRRQEHVESAGPPVGDASTKAIAPSLVADVVGSGDGLPPFVPVPTDLLHLITIEPPSHEIGEFIKQNCHARAQEINEDLTVAGVYQRLREVRPATLGQAARVPGVTPAAISLLLVYLKKRAVRSSTRIAS